MILNRASRERKRERRGREDEGKRRWLRDSSPAANWGEITSRLIMKKLFGSLRREPFRALRHPRSGTGQNYSGRRMLLVLIVSQWTDTRAPQPWIDREIDDILKLFRVQNNPSSLMKRIIKRLIQPYLERKLLYIPCIFLSTLHSPCIFV